MKISQNSVNKTVNNIGRISWCLFISAIFVVGLVAVLWMLEHVNILPESWTTTYWHYARYAFWAIAALAFFMWLVWLVTAFYFQKDDEEDLRERAESPLINLNEAQEKKIIALLKSAAKPSDGSNKMNRSEVATLLAALKKMTLLDDAGNLKKLRLWVEKETEFFDSDNSHFNEAYNRAKKKEIDPRYKAELKNILKY